MKNKFQLNTTLLFLILIISACNQSPNQKNETSKHSKSKNENQTEKKVSQATIIVFPFNGIIAKEDLVKTFFLIGTLWYSRKEDKVNLVFNRITGIATEFDQHKQNIFPSNRNGKLIGVYEYDESTLLIPFHTDIDRENSFITKWKKIGKDSLKYIGYLKEPLDTKYASSFIIDKAQKNGKEFLIGKTVGGEGGDFFQSIWLATYNGTDDFEKINEYDTGHADGDAIVPKLNHRISGDELILLVRTDSMFYEQDTVIEKFIEEKEVKVFKFKQE